MAARADVMNDAHRYTVYGECLQSTMPFPELAESTAPEAKWRFETTAQLPAMRDPVDLGADNISADVHARLFRHADGHRISVDDTGTFDMSSDGRLVRWQQREESWPDFVRAHLMGRVLATAMFHDGWLPLHGSAVALRDGVVAFLAPRGFGKTSLALALTQLGARLVTDDTLPVQLPAQLPAQLPPQMPVQLPAPSAGTTAPLGAAPGDILAWPGVHSMRLRADVGTALGIAAPDLETREGKWLVNDIAADRRAESCLPLRAIYLIDPVAPDTATLAAARTQMPPTFAAVGVVAHVKIGRMLGPSAAAAMLERAAVITRSVPVYRLHAARDLAQLPALASTIADWHGGIS